DRTSPRLRGDLRSGVVERSGDRSTTTGDPASLGSVRFAALVEFEPLPSLLQGFLILVAECNCLLLALHCRFEVPGLGIGSSERVKIDGDFPVGQFAGGRRIFDGFLAVPHAVLGAGCQYPGDAVVGGGEFGVQPNDRTEVVYGLVVVL